IYILFLKLLGYNYYNHEMETYRQGIWYLDILKGKGFWFLLEESLGKVRIILENALTAIRLGFGLLVVFLMFAFKRGISMKSEVIFRFCITYLVFGFLFWLWVGYTPVRLMFTFYPTVYLSLSYLIEEVLSFKQVEAISGNPSL
ncbi:MAG: hypothetical protein N3C62_06735, partial [Synergistetes bacterium]|nr:hypothetical protein [Synergistota bacterium]